MSAITDTTGTGTNPAAAADAGSEDALKYPIGRLQRKASYSSTEREGMIVRLAEQPASLQAAIAGMDDAQLDTPYRPGGWTVRQLVHHIADSHLNAYIRVKLAITEDEPTVKPYDQDAWVQLADVNAVAASVSVALFEATHARLVPVLRAMSPDDFGRGLMHPENGRMTIDDVVATYSWHGDHHIAHILSLRGRSGW